MGPAEGGRGFLPAAGGRLRARGSGSAGVRVGQCGQRGVAPWVHAHQAAEASAQSGEEVGDGSAVAVDPEGPQVPGRAWEGTGARLGVRA